ncbi:MAG: hypothetical protein RLY20_1221, partial [Verrucomicrobiota bacterium]
KKRRGGDFGFLTFVKLPYVPTFMLRGLSGNLLVEPWGKILFAFLYRSNVRLRHTKEFRRFSLGSNGSALALISAFS